jgi:exopolysaccharide biosynthesis protein
MRVDLANSNIKVDALQNKTSLRNLNSTINLAKSNNAIAAINGSFMNWGKASEPGTGSPIGPIVKSGVIQAVDAATNQTANKFATVSISKMNKALFGFWKTSMTLTAPTGLSVPVARYNETYSGHTDYTILDSKSRAMTIGTTYCAKPIVEMVVDKGIVTEIRKNLPSVQMPANGYIVVTRTDGSKFLYDNFKVGDPVGLKITTTPDWNALNMSVSGGSMLIKNGKIPTVFSHYPSGDRYYENREARTAIGSTKDGKQIIMITVDDKSGISSGMTQKELATYLLSKGAYNALNLDGGSSATMVARAQESGVLELINAVKEGTQRSVVNAIGLFSTSKPSALSKLVIYTDNQNVFVNTSRNFTVKGYDKYSNPVAINSKDIVWSNSGFKGSFSGSTLRPTSVGSGYVYAAIGKIKGKIDVSSLSSPVQLILNTKSINVTVSKTAKLTVTGKNKNGYYAPISPNDVKWSTAKDIGYVKNGVFNAKQCGTCIIDASVGSTHSYALATVTTVLGLNFASNVLAAERFTLPQDTPIKDADKRYVNYKNSSTSLIFSVFGNVSGITDSTKKAVTSTLIKKINSSYSAGAFLCSGENKFQKTIKKPNISTDHGYKYLAVKNSLFVQLDCSQKSLRLTNSSEWRWFMSKINSTTKNNIFIFMSRSPGTFKDLKEADLLQSFLTKYKQKTNKNIWVFYNGTTNSSYMERGVKYISTAGFAVKNFSSKNKSAAKYALVKVMGNSITYGFASIIP